jgi:putative hydrolase
MSPSDGVTKRGPAVATGPAVAPRPTVTADQHVHSTFSDGEHSPAENVAAALALGLGTVALTEHVRRSTTWLPHFVRAVDGLRDAPITLRCGVEAKLLDVAGRLDVPDDLSGVELLLVADHQVPTPIGPAPPDVVAAALARAAIRAPEVIGWLIEATMAASTTAGPQVVLAHLFSILPKLGLTEAAVPDALLSALAGRCRDTGAWLELNEKWGCPGPRVIGAFVAAGVPLVFGSDAHRRESIGRFPGALERLHRLRAGVAA